MENNNLELINKLKTDKKIKNALNFLKEKCGMRYYELAGIGVEKQFVQFCDFTVERIADFCNIYMKRQYINNKKLIFHFLNTLDQMENGKLKKDFPNFLKGFFGINNKEDDPDSLLERIKENLEEIGDYLSEEEIIINNGLFIIEKGDCKKIIGKLEKTYDFLENFESKYFFRNEKNKYFIEFKKMKHIIYKITGKEIKNSREYVDKDYELGLDKKLHFTKEYAFSFEKVNEVYGFKQIAGGNSDITFQRLGSIFDDIGVIEMNVENGNETLLKLAVYSCTSAEEKERSYFTFI